MRTASIVIGIILLLFGGFLMLRSATDVPSESPTFRRECQTEDAKQVCTSTTYASPLVGSVERLAVGGVLVISGAILFAGGAVAPRRTPRPQAPAAPHPTGAPQLPGQQPGPGHQPGPGRPGAAQHAQPQPGQPTASPSQQPPPPQR